MMKLPPNFLLIVIYRLDWGEMWREHIEVHVLYRHFHLWKKEILVQGQSGWLIALSIPISLSIQIGWDE